MARDDQPDAKASRRPETSGLDALTRRLGPPTSRLSVAAATLVVLTWIVLFIAVMIAELLSVADSIAVPLGVIMVLCLVTSLALGVAALVEHARAPQLRGLAQAIFAVVVSGAELMILLHAYFSGFIGPHGRRLRVRGRPVLARVRARAGEPVSCPSGHLATVATLDEVDRAALRDYWTRVAREEHASITAFEQLAVATDTGIIRPEPQPAAVADPARQELAGTVAELRRTLGSALVGLGFAEGEATYTSQRLLGHQVRLPFEKGRIVVWVDARRNSTGRVWPNVWIGIRGREKHFDALGNVARDAGVAVPLIMHIEQFAEFARKLSKHWAAIESKL